MDAPTSQCVCRSISQANPLRAVLLSAVALSSPASLPSLRGDVWCPHSHLLKWSFNWIRWSTVQLDLRWAHALMRRHRQLVTGAARMGDHNGRASPARCCTWHWQFSGWILGLLCAVFIIPMHCSAACLDKRQAAVKRVCFDHACPHTLQARPSG